MRIYLLAAIGVMACTDPETVVDETVQATKTGCPSWGCGGNSPLIGPYRFNELDENGAPNDSNMRLIGFRQGPIIYRVDVVGDKLYARNGRVTLSGSQLVGGTLELETVPAVDYPGGMVSIRIVHVSNNVTFWQGPATPVETYELQYTGPNMPASTMRPVCWNPPTSDRDPEGGISNRLEAILYTGDRYDAQRKLVTASSYAEAGSWFNIACAGSALAKLHLNRHTTASAVTGYTTTALERQTMLKMYTGDFCGTGEPYTQQGTAIRWSNTKGWASPVPNTQTYESLWNENGAICLSTHRLHGLSPIDFQGDIQGTPLTPGECPKINCEEIAGFPNLDLTGAYMMTQSNGVP